MSILTVNKLALDLVARDFSDGHAATNGGPTKTARALAIIHLAARDAYAKTVLPVPFTPTLPGLPNKPLTLGSTDTEGKGAVLGAGIRAMTALYPDSSQFINDQSQLLTTGADPLAMSYGAEIAERWLASRQGDGSNLPQTDSMYSAEPGHNRPDPVTKTPCLGRTCGQIKPFVLADVTVDAPLGAPPSLTSSAYAKAFDDVFVNGRDNIAQRNAVFQQRKY